LQERLDKNIEKIDKKLQEAEERIFTEQKENIAAIGEKLSAGLEKLKEEASVFENSIKQEMDNVDETRSSFAEQIKKDISEIRLTAENEVKTQVGQYQLSTQEILRQKQKELEKELKDISDRSGEVHSSMDEALVKTKQSFDDWQVQCNNRIREMDESLEKLRANSRDTAAENDERTNQFRQSLEDIRKELAVQKKIFDSTGELKKELEQSMEAIKADMNRLEQNKNEVMRMESEFTRINRLAGEINDKMTRFINEKNRMEQMQNNFDKLIKTQQSVEDRLKQVTSSDDILQTVQLQIRKLEEGLKENEEKFTRIERKNEILDAINEGIARNFKDLQKTEGAIKNAEKIINTLADQFDNLHTSIEALAAESVKATDATEKITALDGALSQIEKRISEMNIAREWLARIETELSNLDKDIKNRYNQTKTLLEKGSGKAASGDDMGALTPQVRENVIRLRKQGFTVEEISGTMKLSRGAVELILEVATRE
jgi:chromosome segregation ATPase